MAKILPRHVLCILGQWSELDSVEAIVHQVAGADFELDREYSQLTPDSRMVKAFEVSYDRVSPSMTEEDWQAVPEHSAVAYVLSPPMPKSSAMNISGQALQAIAALLQEGGVAAKGESVGIAHGRDHWLNLAEEYKQALSEDDKHSQGAKLYWAWVRRPLLDNDRSVMYSCGMHLLGHRDVEIDSSLDLDEALEWIDLLGLYLAADDPQRPIKDGEGFRLTDSRPRRITRLHSCERYEPDEFFFNPYGYIRLES